MNIEKLGVLFLFRVPTGFYSREVITQAMADNGLSIVGKKLEGGVEVETHEVPYMPVRPASGDAFRKATAEAVKSWRNVKDIRGRQVKIRLTDVPTTPGSGVIQKDIVQEIVGGKLTSHFDSASGEQLGENVIEQSIAKVLWREKAPKPLDIRLTTPMDKAIKQGIWAEFAPDREGKKPSYIDLFADIERLLGEIHDLVNDVQLRAFIADTLIRRFNGRVYSEVRGTYFVHPEYEEQARAFETALRAMVNHHNPDAAPFAQAVSLYDEGSVKADMSAYFAQEIEAEVEGLVAEIDVQKGMRIDKVRRMRTEIGRYQRVVELYGDGMDEKLRTKVTKLLTLAEKKVGMSEKQTQIAKEKRAAAKTYAEEKTHSGAAADVRPDEVPSRKAQFRQPATDDKLAAASPRNRKGGLFGNAGKKAS